MTRAAIAKARGSPIAARARFRRITARSLRLGRSWPLRRLGRGQQLLRFFVVIDNYFLVSNPFSKWREAVQASTSPNSPAYFSFEQSIDAPVTTVTTNVSSGPSLPCDVPAGQMIL